MSAAGAGAGVVAAIENEIYQRLFVNTFPGTEFLEPSEICSYFEINNVWKLSEEASQSKVDRVVASLQFHSLQIFSPTPDPAVQPGVYHANLEYEDVPTNNVTRITGADLVPQHAYYYLVMKIYELFLHPAASESMFRHTIDGIADFITETIHPKALGVEIKSKHYCMIARGVSESEERAEMVTSVMRGGLREDFSLRNEFLNLLDR